MAIKVGIPRALLFFEFYPLWISFFENLGAEVVMSQNTNKQIVNEGVKHAVDEACIPIKVFHGHVLDLKDQVDYLFIPRLKSLYKGEYICPKFCGLPEMIKYSIPNLPPIIDTEINFMKSTKHLKDTVYEIGKYFSNDKHQIMSAYKKAYIKWTEHKEMIQKGFLPIDHSKINQNIFSSRQRTSANKRIMLMGHPYNLYDSYLNLNSINKVQSLGVNIQTPEMIPSKYTNTSAKKFDGQLYWTFARKLVGTTLYLIETKQVDGIIYISTFGCGVDSVIAYMVEKIIRKQSAIPFMLVTLDEHSGDAGINTRIEALIDMVKWRDKSENNISTHG
jgi:predicted nucleotide-binding protein (sugar kinase/HSP70/actin superfamily)